MKKITIELNTEETKKMFLYVADQVIESKPLLTEADSFIGDGDHGIGMSVGFKKVKETISEKKYTYINDIFKDIGMSMITSMGGASGIIFGSMFLGEKKVTQKYKLLNTKVLNEIFAQSLLTIKERGKANIGDKTMVDAFEPAVKSLEKSVNIEKNILLSLTDAELKAKEGYESTKDMLANFGRAKSLGERAIGYQDPGATTVWIIFKSMREWLEKVSMK